MLWKGPTTESRTANTAWLAEVVSLYGAERGAGAVSPALLLICAFAAFLLLVPTEPASAREPVIGAVEQVKVLAYGTPLGEERQDLAVRDPVFGEELLETVKGGALRLRFSDDTVFRLGSQSRAVLDKFVYDPDRGSGEIALSLTKGLFRYVTGNLKGESVTLRTPTLTMSVRGTVIVLLVLDDGSSFVWVLEGIGIVTSVADGSTLIVTAETDPVQVYPGDSVTPLTGQPDPPEEDLEPEEFIDALMGVSPDQLLLPNPDGLTIPTQTLPDIMTVTPDDRGAGQEKIGEPTPGQQRRPDHSVDPPGQSINPNDPYHDQQGQ